MTALSTAMQGAQLGGKLGGGWGAAAGGIIGLIAGGKAQKAQEASLRKYNDQVVKAANQDLFDLRRQQNVQNIRTAQALSTYQANSKVQRSSVTANLGAADIIGSSAQALKQVMDYQTKEAQAETMLNWETGIENYNTTIDRAQNARSASLQKNIEGRGQEDLGSLVSGAVGVYNTAKGGGALTSDDLNVAKNKIKHEGYSLMGQLSTLWSGTQSSGVGSSVLPKAKITLSPFRDAPFAADSFKTFKL